MKVGQEIFKHNTQFSFSQPHALLFIWDFLDWQFYFTNTQFYFTNTKKIYKSVHVSEQFDDFDES